MTSLHFFKRLLTFGTCSLLSSDFFGRRPSKKLLSNTSSIPTLPADLFPLLLILPKDLPEFYKFDSFICQFAPFEKLIL